MNPSSQETPVQADADPVRSDWCTPGRFALLLLGLLFAAFPQVFLGLQSFYVRDFGAYSYPVAAYMRESYLNGQIPFWNAYNGCGIPFLAQWSTLTCYPLSLLYVVLPLSWSLGMFCLLHLFLGGLGMYVLARRWIGLGVAAGIAGTAFTFSGLQLSFLMWPHVVAVVAWMPWVFFCAEGAWRKGGRWLAAAVCVGTLQMLCGVPEFILLTWLPVLALAGIDFVRRAAPRVAMVRRLLALVGMVAGLTAFQLLPFFEFIAVSQRSQAFGANEWAMPGTGWANLVVPLFNTYAWSNGIHHQLEQWFVSSYYPGIVVLALALVAVIQCRRRRVTFLGLTALVGLILALGPAGHLYTWLREAIPLLGFMRFPIKFVLLTAFALPLLAGYGADACMRQATGIWRGVVGIGAGLVVIAVGVVLFAHAYPLPWERWNDTLQSGLSRILVLGTGLLVLWFARPCSRGHRASVAGLVLLVLLWLDVRTHTPEQNPTLPRRVYDATWAPQNQTTRMPRLGEGRIQLSAFSYGLLHHDVATNREENFLVHRLGASANLNIIDRVPKTDGFFSLYINGQDVLATQLVAAAGNQAAGLYDFLGVCRVTAPGSVIEWADRPTAMPMVYSGQRPRFVEPADMLPQMLSGEFEPRTTVFLPAELKGTVTATNGRACAITGLNLTHHRITFSTSSPDASLVTLAQTYHRFWRAWVDSKEVPLWRANGSFQAIEVPAGQHVVRVEYVDRAFALGAIISGGTLLTGLCVALRRGHEER